jgi:hypothetical protein
MVILLNKNGYKLLQSLWSYYLFLVLFLFVAVTTTNIAAAQESDQVQKIWETQTQLKTPESVVYEPTENVLFVSSIDGKPDEKWTRIYLQSFSYEWDYS